MGIRSPSHLAGEMDPLWQFEPVWVVALKHGLGSFVFCVALGSSLLVALTSEWRLCLPAKEQGPALSLTKEGAAAPSLGPFPEAWWWQWGWQLFPTFVSSIEIARHFRFGNQEDAHEFLRYTIDAMQKACLNGCAK